MIGGDEQVSQAFVGVEGEELETCEQLFSSEFSQTGLFRRLEKIDEEKSHL